MKIDLLYVEEEILHHPRVQDIIKRFPSAHIVSCHRYTEIFNRNGQNFRLQKKNPTFILAKKYGNFLHPIPNNYGIGAKKNYYFSHMLNCPFDCSYCFLQGMYRSAHYVFFVNFEDFQEEINNHIENETVTFFSGYDGDSLALEPFTGFLKSFLPFFANHPKAELELRTKSIQIRELLLQKPFSNCIVSFTLTPSLIADQLEKRAPPLKKRVEAMQKLQKKGWKIGLRFDPVIHIENFEFHYSELFQTVFSSLPKEAIHSVTLGAFRLPKTTYARMQKLRPEDKLLSLCSESENSLMTFEKSIEQKLLSFCQNAILSYIEKKKVFLCQPIDPS